MEEEEGGLCRSVPAVPNFRRRPKPTIPLHSKCIKDQLCFWHHAFSTNRSPTISSSIQSSTRRGELYLALSSLFFCLVRHDCLLCLLSNLQSFFVFFSILYFFKSPFFNSSHPFLEISQISSLLSHSHWNWQICGSFTILDFVTTAFDNSHFLFTKNALDNSAFLFTNNRFFL